MIRYLLRRRRACAISSSPSNRGSTSWASLTWSSVRAVSLFNRTSPTVEALLPWRHFMKQEISHSAVFEQLGALNSFNASRIAISYGRLSETAKHPNLHRGLSVEASEERLEDTYSSLPVGHTQTVSEGRDTLDEKACRSEAGDPFGNGEGDTHTRAAEALDIVESVEDTYASPPPDHSKLVTEVCDILQSKPWGPETAEMLEKLNVSYDSHIVKKVITATASTDVAVGFFNWLTCNSFEHDVHTYGAVINVLGAAGCLDNMKRLAEEMQKVLGSCLYDNLIHWCAHAGDTAGAIGYLEEMNQKGIPMEVSTYTTIFDLYAKEKRYKEAADLYLQMVEEGIFPSSRTLTVLIRHLLEVGKLESAHMIFNILSKLKVKPEMSTYAYLMAAYAKVGNMMMLNKLGREMRDSYNRPGKIFCIAIESLHREGKIGEAEAFAEGVWPELSAEERRLKVLEIGNISQDKKIEEGDLLEDLAEVEPSFKELEGNGREARVPVVCDNKFDVFLSEIAKSLETQGFSVLEQVNVDWSGDAVYKMLRQFKNPNVAWEFFRWLKACPGFKHDIYNEITMLRMLAQNMSFSALKELLTDMQGEGVKVPINTFNTIMKDCGLVKNSKAAIWVFSRIKESNLEPNEETFTALVHALARGKCPEKAFELSELMQHLGIKLDIETYTAVIHSLGLAGKAKEAWSVYQKMLDSGLSPDVYTYTALLNVVYSAGDTDFAVQLYEEMKNNGIAPTAVTQGIMARVWRTSGNPVEAQKLEVQAKFLFSKNREDALQYTYETLVENLVDQERSSSLLF